MKRFLIKEDPDEVWLEHNSIVNYRTGPNIAFIIFKDDKNVVRLEYIDSKDIGESYAPHCLVRNKIRKTNPEFSTEQDSFVTGRIWPEKNLASTYEHYSRVMEYAKLIENLFKQLNLNINTFDWDFYDSYNLKEFKKWPMSSTNTSSKSQNPELLKQINNIIIQLHTANPEEKIKLRKKLEHLQKQTGIGNDVLYQMDKILSDKLTKKLGGEKSGESIAQMKYRLGLDEVEFDDVEFDDDKITNSIPQPVSLNNVEDEKGYWVSPDGKIYDVDSVGGHAKFAEDFIFNLKSYDDFVKKVNSGEINNRDIRIDAINLGWVRIRLHKSAIYKIPTKHRHILEVQAKKINFKQKQILSFLVKSKDAESMSVRDFEKYVMEFYKRHQIKNK